MLAKAKRDEPGVACSMTEKAFASGFHTKPLVRRSWRTAKSGKHKKDKL